MVHQTPQGWRELPRSPDADREPPFRPGVANSHGVDRHRPAAASRRGLRHHRDAHARLHHPADRIEAFDAHAQPQDRAQPAGVARQVILQRALVREPNEIVIGLRAALTVYGASGLGGLSFSVGRAREWWVGPVIGGITGAVTAVTGVFVLPATPYLRAIGLEKERLVQALGLSFTVSTFALAADLASTGSLGAALAGKSTVALLMALIGMRIGQALRLRLKPATFRRWFFSGLCALGLGICLQALH